MTKLSTIFTILTLALSACNSSPTPTQTVLSQQPATVEKSTPLPVSSTEAPKLTPTTALTDTPSPSATPTPLPDDMREAIMQTYKGMLLVQLNANFLKETASKVNKGELGGFESLGAVIAVAALISGTQQAFEVIQPPEILTTDWQQAQKVHEATKDILIRWLDKDIDSGDVLNEIAGPLNEIEAALSSADHELSIRYGIDEAELRSERAAVMTSVGEIFATPTAIPEGASGPLIILSHKSYQEGDYYTIIGEVQNTSNEPMEFVKIVATLYDGNGQVVNSNYSYSILDSIPAGGKSPFEISTNDWQGTKSYKLQVQGEAGDTETTHLTIPSHQSYIDGDYYTIIGEVENTSDQPMEFVKVVATLYDDAGKVVGTTSTYTLLDAILAGGKSPFELSTSHWEGGKSYSVQVQGREGSLGRDNLVINSHKSSQSGNYLSIDGEIVNHGSTPAEFVKIIATLYDADGKVVGEGYSYSTLDKIPPGGTSPFEISTSHFDNYDHYVLLVEGQ
jgi:hypothetical protein